MSNVISLRPPQRQSEQDRVATLIDAVANQRRARDDVFWLKENAELLGVLKATDREIDPAAFAPFETFYNQIEDRLQFFPQYYRFLLSICLDLEDLGYGSGKGAGLAAWVAAKGLPEAELSDLQRAEARRLVARRCPGVLTDTALDQRLHQFIARSDTFAMPNKKAAYELTHIVFYLSEYGTRDPELTEGALTSLRYAGLLAYLDQNADLLAEVCTAMRYAGMQPSPLWEDFVAQVHQRLTLHSNDDGALMDGFHAYLVTGWAMHAAGRSGFGAEVPQGALRFALPTMPPEGALRTLSECMFDLGTGRSDDWNEMRTHVLPRLGAEGQAVLHNAEHSTQVFDTFFAGFARAGGM